MKTIIQSIILCGLLVLRYSDAIPIPPPTDFSQINKPKTMKILLYSQVPQALIEVKGKHGIYSPLDGIRISWGIINKRHQLQSESYGIRWGEKFIGHHQLRIVPTDARSSILVNGIQYEGCIEIYHNNGKFDIINEIDVEKYLKATLSYQLPYSFSEEVMNAIAIIARTHAYFETEQYKQAFWHLTKEDIPYGGAAFFCSPEIEKAVNTTRHAILTYKDNPFPATWTANSAGNTVSFSSVFRKSCLSPPGVQVPFAAKNRSQYKWTCEVPKEKLAKLFHLDDIQSIDLYVTPEGSKVYAIKISSEIQAKDYDFLTLQRAIGADQLKSNDFTVTSQGDFLIFTGYGEGCGVGLCLYTAQNMAQKGATAPLILETFYPETQIKKIY